METNRKEMKLSSEDVGNQFVANQITCHHLKGGVVAQLHNVPLIPAHISLLASISTF